jgi:hypothetical protein
MGRYQTLQISNVHETAGLLVLQGPDLILRWCDGAMG